MKKHQKYINAEHTPSNAQKSHQNKKTEDIIYNTRDRKRRKKGEWLIH